MTYHKPNNNSIDNIKVIELSNRYRNYTLFDILHSRFYNRNLLFIVLGTFIFYRAHFSIHFIAMSYCFAVTIINVCMPRLRRNKQNVKKEKNKAAFSQSSNVYNSLSTKNLQQQQKAGSSFPEPKEQRFTGIQIDAGKSYCIIFLFSYCVTASSYSTRESVLYKCHQPNT